MLDILFSNYIAAYIILLIFAIGAVSRLVLGIFLSEMIKESENINGAKKHNLKQIKLKFESYYRLDLQINNVTAFINKYLVKYKCLGISIKKFNNVGSICYIFCVTLGILSGSIIYINYQSISEMLMYITEGLVLFLFGLIWGYLIDIDSKIEILKINIQDYLENNLRNKLINEEAKKENLAAQNFQAVIMEKESSENNKVIDIADLEIENDIINNNVIEEILKEYLV